MSAYSQFGYSYPTSQLLVGSQSSGGSIGMGGGVTSGGVTSPPSSCCEGGRPLMTDPVTGQGICSCQYNPLTSPYSHPRLSTPMYPSTDQNPYPSIAAVDSSAFYSPLTGAYGLKDGSSADMSAWTQSASGYYPYDPALAAYGYGAGYDLAARRKNATRESTATLKAWLSEHKKNPYPTKGEKIMLAIITKMTLTQVSTWFANARRRLKKENKMTWEPKNRVDDEDATLSDDDVDGKDDKDDKKDDLDKLDSENECLGETKPTLEELGSQDGSGTTPISPLASSPDTSTDIKPSMAMDRGIPLPANKPKIWSLADTAACKTPPPTHSGLGMGQHQQHHHPQQWPPSSGAFQQVPSSFSYNRYSNLFNSGGQNYSGLVNSGGMPTGTGNVMGGSGSCSEPTVQTDTPPQTPPSLKMAQYGHSNMAPSMNAQQPQQLESTAFRPVYKSSNPYLSGV